MTWPLGFPGLLGRNVTRAAIRLVAARPASYPQTASVSRLRRIGRRTMAASTLAPPAPPLAEPSAGEAAPTEPTRELDESVSFPELVWAHFVRQKELHDSGGIDSAEEQVYRERLKRFKDEHGELVN